MALSFSGYQTRSVRFQQELNASTGQVLGATARQAITELPIPSIRRIFELEAAEQSGTRLDQQAAQQRIADAGLTGRLTVPEEGMSDAALDILIQRKREEIKRQEVLSRSPGGFGLGAAQLGTAFAASLLDPLNVGLAFVPVVGQARYLRYLANAKGALGRTGVRAGVGAVEGAAGAAIIEPLVYAAKTHEQADYDFQDSLLNVAFGTVFGGGLHTSFGAMADALRRSSGRTAPWAGLEGLTDDADVALVRNLREDIARGRLTDRRDIARVLDTWSPQARKAVADVLPTPDSVAARVADMPPPVREHALRTAVAQAMRGREVEVEPIAGPARTPITVEDLSPQPLTPVTRRDANLIDVDATEKALPPVPDGHIRLYRASSPTESFDDVFDAEQLQDFRTLHGRSYTTDLKTADYYRSSYGKDATIEYADVPAERLDGREAAAGEYVLERSKSGQQRASISEARAAAERQASPESDVVADVRASEAADRQLAELPAGTDDVAIQESLLADEMAELQEVARIRDIDLTDELAEFDEAIELANTYSKAAKAAVLCGLGH